MNYISTEIMMTRDQDPDNPKPFMIIIKDRAVRDCERWVVASLSKEDAEEVIGILTNLLKES